MKSSDGSRVKALFVEAKLQASEELGHYIDELNVSLEEKRVVFHKAQKSECTVLSMSL